ncbi:Pentatricopeptide repeat-containing protein [Quillaja saponaria]|uniref:Pentatricopeptide repeat-containing protein n=1 Tax=Quillaja saponaria TaxID=32244 RepID=A0AAD7P7Q1_QUISA|nr:Pentatricopeptide repeat-containing protein [Quillaja saponaria]
MCTSSIAWLIKTGQSNNSLSLRRLLLCCAASAPESLCYARLLFARILSPETFSYNIVIRAHAHFSPFQAFSLFFQMRRTGVSPDNFTFPFVLKACARLQMGLDLHSLIVKLGFDSDIYVQNAMINLYGSHCLVELAMKLFNEMLEKDLVSWSSIIACFANNGFGYEALALFQQMQLQQNVKPDEVTMLSVISAISSLGALELGNWVHRFVSRSGLELTVSLGTAMVNMYSRCGSIYNSIEVFDQMPVKNLLTWTALINGLAVHGLGREALRAFYDLRKSGFQPDYITLTGVLVACSHSGLVEDGWRIFESMRNEYNMEPLLEHYGCMVDLLGRAGRLHEAFEFVGKMPTKPNAIVWRTLLGACVNHNHLELAERAEERIYELDPHHDGDYVLLSNAYGGVGKWVEKTRVRNSMREKRIPKKPGYSLINIDQVIHEFVSGDNSHPQWEEIRKFLASVMSSVKVGGYTPHTSNVLHDIEEEEKEHNLCYHSEKLAVAFVLLNHRDRRIITVIKNLRICHDCHNFMKIVSNIFDRKIIIRDQNRFHHFREGSCSCHDYWRFGLSSISSTLHINLN